MIGMTSPGSPQPPEEVNRHIGLEEAARTLGTTKQTIRNLAAKGTISTVTDEEILRVMNIGKRGRPFEALYIRSELMELRKAREDDMVDPTEDGLIGIEDAAKALCVTVRTLCRIRQRIKMREYPGLDGLTYIELVDIARLRPGADYHSIASAAELQKAADRYGLTKERDRIAKENG